MEDIKQIEILCRLKPYQRIKIAFELYDFARARISAEIKRNNPTISKEELLRTLNERFDLAYDSG